MVLFGLAVVASVGVVLRNSFVLGGKYIEVGFGGRVGRVGRVGLLTFRLLHSVIDSTTGLLSMSISFSSVEEDMKKSSTSSYSSSSSSSSSSSVGKKPLVGGLSTAASTGRLTEAEGK